MRILLISTADWDHPFWTNKQHVAATLADMGHDVLYVDSLAIRSMKSADLNANRGRIIRRLRSALRAPRRVREGVRVVSPLVLPAWDRRPARWVNRMALAIQSGFWRLNRFSPDVVLTYSPITLVAWPRLKWPIYYHLVDDISTQPGMPQALIRQAEDSLLNRARLVFATSPALVEIAAAIVPPERVIEQTNVVGDECFVTRSGVARPADLPPGPVVGFVGAVSQYKFDFDLYRSLVKLLPEVNFTIIGKVGEGQLGQDYPDFFDLPNVFFLGPKPYAEVPHYMTHFDVAVLPCPLNDYTRAMFPMKFFEYLAAGAAVVSTHLESIQPFSDVAFFAESADAFAKEIRNILNSGNTHADDGILVAREHTYRSRTEAMVRYIENEQ